MKVYVAGDGSHALVEGEEGDVRVLEPARIPGRVISREQRPYGAYDCVDYAAALKKAGDVAQQNALLDLLLVALDQGLSLPVRAEAVELLNRRLVQDGGRDLLEAIIFAAPLPDPDAVTEAVTLCDQLRCGLLQLMLTDWLEHQSAIADVRSAWLALPSSFFGGIEDRQWFETASARAGVSRRFARAIGSGRTIDSALFESLFESSAAQLTNERDVLLAWTRPFERSVLREPSEPEADRPTSQSTEREHGTGILARVDRQKRAIKRLLHKGEFERAMTFVRELIEYQSRTGTPEHIAKSLCDLAMYAKALAEYDVQLDLMVQAVEIAPLDVWSNLQYADALMLRSPSEALAVYDKAVRLGAGSIGHDGRAQALRLLFRYDEALSAYETGLELDADDVIPHLGIAETYRAMGRWSEAFRRFADIIDEFPWHEGGYIGTVETLRDWNRLEEALSASVAIPEHLQNDYVLNSRAAILRALGRFDAALEVYEQFEAVGRSDFAVAGRAQTLAKLGRRNDAEELLRERLVARPRSEHLREAAFQLVRDGGNVERAFLELDRWRQAVPHSRAERVQRAELLRTTGRSREAVALLEGSGPTADPRERAAHVAALRSSRRIREALALAKDSIQRFPFDVALRVESAELLRILGRVAEARSELDDIRVRRGSDEVPVAIARARLDRSVGRVSDAEAGLRALVGDAPWDPRPQLALAKFLKQANRPAEALTLYDSVRRLEPARQIAQRGWISCLILLERGDEAFRSLAESDADDIFSLHLKGIVALAGSGDVSRAVELLSDANGEYLAGEGAELARAAFALALIHAGRPQEVRVERDESADDALQTLIDVIDLHAAGATGDRPRAADALQRLRRIPVLSEVEDLVEELGHRYVTGRGGQHDDAWILRAEVRLLAEAA